MQEERLTPAEEELADSLRRLKLAPLNLSASSLYFQAGQQAERRSARHWKVLAALFGLTTLVSLWARPMSQSLPQQNPSAIARVPADHLMTATHGISPALLQSAANLKLRDAILEKGLSAWPLPEMTGEAAPLNSPASNPSWNDNPDAFEELGILYRG